MDELTPLEKMREFVSGYPDFDILSTFQIDYTDSVPDNGGLFPTGIVEVSRVRDITGGALVENQYNFALYAMLTKAPNDDTNSTYNAEWVMGFQEWIQAQSIKGLAPTFGDYPNREVITAQNGTLYSAEEEGTALYFIQLSVNFFKEY